MTEPLHDPPSDDSRARSAGRRRAVGGPLLAAGTALAVVLGGGYALRQAAADGPGTGSGATPPVLRLAGYQPAPDQAADDTFRLATALPGGPDEAPVRWLTRPQRADAERLATELGLGGDRAQADGATTYTSEAATLRVQEGPGGAWQFVRGSITGATTACIPPYPTPAPKDGGPAMDFACDAAVSSSGSDMAMTTTDETARRTALPVLEAAGVDVNRARVRATPGPQAVVAADPRVQDLPTDGLRTTVVVAGQQVNAANGWLGGSREGATYPLVSAEAAWQKLIHTPLARPAIGCPEAGTDDVDPLLCGGPITVTAARYGLSLQQEGDRPVLVPSWLFDLRGADNPLSVVAVADRYLAAPLERPASGAVSPATPGTGTGTSTSGTSTAGSSTSDPGRDLPATPAPASRDSRFSSVRADDSGSGLVVEFTGGVAACFTYTVVAKETDVRVALSLVEKVSSDKRCIELAQVYERAVPLDQPLAGRQVVDATTGGVLLGGRH